MSEGYPGFNWTRLLREIRREQVIPIIGPELFSYHQALAAPLASALGLPSSVAGLGITAVADAYALQNRDIRDAVDALAPLLDAHVEPPDVMELLAGIEQFRLLVTTDYGSFLERVLAVRGEPVRSLGFALSHRAHDIEGFPQRGRCVYHLLGHLEHFGAIALAQVDQLEYLYALQAEGGPSELLQVLRERRNLLFLGCNFPEWLAGFFTRILVGKPLYETRQRGMEVIACRSAASTGGSLPPLTAFLRDNHVDVYDGDAQTFVRELARRYTPPPSQPQARAERPNGKGYIFVSYSRKNLEPTRALVSALRARGFEVWFDENNLQPGDRFDDEIRLAIHEDSAAFVPVISRQVFDADQSYFIREWHCAAEIGPECWHDVKFVFPVVIDEQGQGDVITQLRRRFPAFAQLHIESSPGGRQVSDGLIEELREARKRYERRRRARA